MNQDKSTVESASGRSPRRGMRMTSGIGLILIGIVQLFYSLFAGLMIILGLAAGTFTGIMSICSPEGNSTAVRQQLQIVSMNELVLFLGITLTIVAIIGGVLQLARSRFALLALIVFVAITCWLAWIHFANRYLWIGGIYSLLAAGFGWVAWRSRPSQSPTREPAMVEMQTEHHE